MPAILPFRFQVLAGSSMALLVLGTSAAQAIPLGTTNVTSEGSSTSVAGPRRPGATMASPTTAADGKVVGGQRRPGQIQPPAEDGEVVNR